MAHFHRIGLLGDMSRLIFVRLLQVENLKKYFFILTRRGPIGSATPEVVFFRAFLVIFWAFLVKKIFWPGPCELIFLIRKRF